MACCREDKDTMLPNEAMQLSQMLFVFGKPKQAWGTIAWHSYPRIFEHWFTRFCMVLIVYRPHGLWKAASFVLRVRALAIHYGAEVWVGSWQWISQTHTTYRCRYALTLYRRATRSDWRRVRCMAMVRSKAVVLLGPVELSVQSRSIEPSRENGWRKHHGWRRIDMLMVLVLNQSILSGGSWWHRRRGCHVGERRRGHCSICLGLGQVLQWLAFGIFASFQSQVGHVILTNAVGENRYGAVYVWDIDGSSDESEKWWSFNDDYDKREVYPSKVNVMRILAGLRCKFSLHQR